MLVLAIKSGKHGNNLLLNENDSGMQLQGISSVSKNIANDISKYITSKALTVANQSSSPAVDDMSLVKFGKSETVISMPNNDDNTIPNRLAVTADACTSLLDSHDSVVTLPNKNSFPTSVFQQFWILLKRSFITILRDKQLMHLRLMSHIVVGTIIGMIYYDIGNDASKVMSNAGCIFFTTLFTMFTGMMPTILTCKLL